MKKIDILNIDGEKVSDITLNKDVFEIEPNDTVLYDALTLVVTPNLETSLSILLANLPFGTFAKNIEYNAPCSNSLSYLL